MARPDRRDIQQLHSIDFPKAIGIHNQMSSTLILKIFPGMGRGVCSTVPVRRGEIVEVSPVIPLSAKDWKLIKHTLLETYVFAWGKSQRLNAMPMGFGGLFNHSDDPNVDFQLNLKEKTVTFRALRDIAALEQLTIDYRWPKKDRKKHLKLPN